MRVCHMTSAHNSNDVRIFHKECTSLAKAGYDTYLVAKGESREENGVHVVGVGNAPPSRIQRMTKFAKVIFKKAFELDADIYHLHDPELLPYALKLKRHGKKVIFDSHENYTMQIYGKAYIPNVLRGMVSTTYNRYETHVIRALDAVVVPCTFEGRNIFENCAKRTILIGNYPLSSEFYDCYNPTAEKNGSVCYVGGLTYDRGIYHLVQASFQAETPLVLAGAFNFPSFEEEIRALPAFQNVDYLGVVSRSEVAEINQHAIAGTCTLLKNGQYDKFDTFGIKVFEYMAMGLPVILTDYPYAREVLKTYQFGICVDPNDVSAIADAIVYLRDHPEEARVMGENGRRAVDQEFNWGTQEQKLLGLYQDLLDTNLRKNLHGQPSYTECC